MRQNENTAKYTENKSAFFAQIVRYFMIERKRFKWKVCRGAKIIYLAK